MELKKSCLKQEQIEFLEAFAELVNKYNISITHDCEFNDIDVSFIGSDFSYISFHNVIDYNAIVKKIFI